MKHYRNKSQIGFFVITVGEKVVSEPQVYLLGYSWHWENGKNFKCGFIASLRNLDGPGLLLHIISAGISKFGNIFDNFASIWGNFQTWIYRCPLRNRPTGHRVTLLLIVYTVLIQEVARNIFLWKVYHLSRDLAWSFFSSNWMKNKVEIYVFKQSFSKM